ncbi:MAG TPA: thiol reductant ABC exporter subunit CydD [Marinobacter sp.]|uniref:thiol reductant ABC exporter subunit CydD n=1 Tax=Marinobacter sp. TaxID=50741 RepID=UPI002D80DB64|nr:thiol reductant ABC exporter subunit CydD [Marinobacter sp.]HET8801449.1 thiol reductant ABC exporter subunit CydD [Marinobacter sp.]
MAEGQNVRQWLDDLCRGSRRWIQGTIAAGILAAMATVAQMVFLARIVHLGVIGQAPVQTLSPLFLGLAVSIIVRTGAQGLQTRLAARCSEQVRRDARRQLHHHWQSLGPVELGKHSAGTLAREWIDHVEALHGYFARFLPQLALATLIPLGILALVFYLDWLAGVFLLLSAPLIPLFMALVGMGAETLNQKHFRTISRLSGQFLDKVRGLTTLQLFGQTEGAASLIALRSDGYRQITMKTLRVAFLSSAVLEFFSSVAIAVVAIYIGFGLLGYIEFGPARELTLFTGLLILLLAPEFFQPLRTLSQHYHDRAAAMGAGAELLARLKSSPTLASTPATQASTATRGPEFDGIQLTGVSVRYQSSEPVFSQLSLTFRRGDVIALTGPSGGGKTTLLNLIAGFLPPGEGTIEVLGRSPGHSGFGWLGQKGFLVHGTWADNLRLTTPDASDVAIETALRSVGLGALLDSRPEGINSAVSEDGQGLSGGQSRRLSLARLFVADYDLILLDEPTAGLDVDSEIFVLEALHKLAMAGKTLVFSSHHHALLTLANRVLVVSGGEVRDA